jgi:hypothetical protein
MSKPDSSARFVASKEDPSRAAALSRAEHERLFSGLQTAVMPGFANAAARLHANRFVIVKLQHRGDLASLIVKSKKPGVHAWIYFQIHHSFAPMVSSEPVFWMYSVHRPEQAPGGKAGRLRNLEDAAAIAIIVAEFTEMCLDAAG